MAGRRVQSSLTKSIALSLFLLTLFSVSFQSCVQSEQIKRVNPQKVIALLDGGPHQGTWKTKDISFQYNYHHRPDQFTISGKFYLSKKYTMDYNTVNNFWVSIYLLDAEQNVLKSFPMVNVAFSTQVDKQAVEHRFELSGITGMTFGYSGQIRTSGAILDLFESPFN